MKPSWIGVVGVCTILMYRAAAAEQSSPRRSADALPATAPGALARQRGDFAPRGSPSNRWRYSFRHGHWWYYRDGGRWAYWTGLQWVEYEPNSYRQWYLRQEMTDVDARLARFDDMMRPYLSDSFGGPIGDGPISLSEPTTGYKAWQPALGGSGAGGLFYPRPFDGRLNPATSIGGYMGSALRGPFGD